MRSNLDLVTGSIPGIYLKVPSKTMKTWWLHPMSQLSQGEVRSPFNGTSDCPGRAVKPKQWRLGDLYGLWRNTARGLTCYATSGLFAQQYYFVTSWPGERLIMDAKQIMLKVFCFRFTSKYWRTDSRFGRIRGVGGWTGFALFCRSRHKLEQKQIMDAHS